MNDKNRIRKPADKLVSECFKEYRLKLFRYCLARLDGSREDADDCVQDSFLVFQKTLAEGKTVENPRAFLYRTAENFVKRRKEENAKAAKRNVPLEFAENTATVEYDYLRAVDETDYDLLAEKLINTLTPNEKQLYDLRYRQKNEVNQIAGSLGISPAAVSMRLMRLRDKVKQIVYEKGG